MKKMVFTPFYFEVYKNLKCNERLLPKNFPGRPFTDVSLADYELSILCGNIADVYQDMYILNTWIIGKYGKGRRTETALDEKGRAMLEVMRGLVNTCTMDSEQVILEGKSLKHLHWVEESSELDIINADDIGTLSLDILKGLDQEE